MADVQFIPYSDEECWAPCVCSVDDAWFEGGKDYEALFAQFELGGIHKQSKSLSRLLEILETRPALMGTGDAQYLKAVADQCSKHGFKLFLCNFEGLRAHWNELNCKGTSILLDLNYEKCPEGEVAQQHGLHLIHELLDGQRPYADVFIVTGAPKTFHDKLAEQDLDSSWWPIRSFPVVSKATTTILQHDLECFTTYFKQGNRGSPIAELLRILVRPDLKEWSHPAKFDWVPRDLPFRSLYEDNLSAIKALFHHQQQYTDRADYFIPASVLASLLSTSGFRVLSPPKGPLEIRLPLAPFGILWVAQVWDFLYWLTEQKKADQDGNLQINEKGFVSILVPLNPQFLSGFMAALNGERRRGYASQALEALKNLEFRDGMLVCLREDERPRVRECLDQVTFKDKQNYTIDCTTDSSVTIRWKGIFN